jgi:nucleoid-associated protein YgaU
MTTHHPYPVFTPPVTGPTVGRGGRRTVAHHLVPIRLLVLLILAAGAFLLFSLRVEAGMPVVVDEVVVQSGDTLWGIASTASAPGEDVRETIARIMELNGLSSSTIRPGQRLVVPGS